MSLLDILTGGKSDEAADALKRAEAYFGNVKLPTAQELTLPELQKYVQMGILTPAEAQAVLIQGNAYNDIQNDQGATEAQQDTLSKLKAIAEAGGMTPQMKARLTEALDQVATTTRGTNAAISDQFAQRGIPSSLMAEAAMRSEAADAARNANLTATQAAGDAEARALEALANEGNLATTMRGQTYQQGADKAAAENAIRQWNAGTATNTNEANAGRQMQSNIYNTTTGQNVADQNVNLGNQRTYYNAAIPQQMYNNAMNKAAGQAGAAQRYGDLIQSQGGQNAAINAGIISAVTNAIPNPAAKVAGNQSSGIVNGAAASNYSPNVAPDQYYKLGYDQGGRVPGNAMVDGDSNKNDTVPAMLSPGEVVVPRSIANDPEAVKKFVQNLAYGGKVDKTQVTPEAINAVLEALSRRVA